MDNQSIQHTRWNCTYHVVFIPKYRKKLMYGTVKRDVGEVIRKLCEMKGVTLIEGKACVDHVHIYVAIPPKISVSDFMAYLKGKSALMIFDRHPELRPLCLSTRNWRKLYSEFQFFILFPKHHSYNSAEKLLLLSFPQNDSFFFHNIIVWYSPILNSRDCSS